MQPIHNEKLELSIERIVPRGYGIGFADGKTIFVSLAVPGDVVRVRIAEVKGNIAFAEIDQVVSPSPRRIAPPCPYFGVCGGCDFQQMDYAAQLDAKVNIIRDSLRRIGRIDYDREIPIIPSPRELEYRSRAQWHLDPSIRGIGYFKRNSRDLVEIDRCPKLVPELNEELERLRAELPWEDVWSPKAYIDAAVADEGQVSLNSPGLFDPVEISYSAVGETFDYSAGVFFQGNKFLIPELLQAAIGDTAGRFALDLYCGVGLFSLPLARKFDRVIGVEENPGSVEFANRNAQQNGLQNVDFRKEPVRRFLASTKLRDVDFVLLDPPRAGTEKETMHNLIALSAPQVSYVACDPGVLARDLKRFVENGYMIDSIVALDLFPQTHHVETVARLSKR